MRSSSLLVYLFYVEFCKCFQSLDENEVPLKGWVNARMIPLCWTNLVWIFESLTMVSRETVGFLYSYSSDGVMIFSDFFSIFTKIIVRHLRSLFLAGKGTTAASPCFFSAPSSRRPYMDRADCRNRDSLFSCRNMEHAYLVFSKNIISVQLKEHGTCIWIVFIRNMISVRVQEHGTCVWIVFSRNMLKSVETFIALVFSRTMLSILTGKLNHSSAAWEQNHAFD